jgi:hypothetical protein
MPSAKGGEVLAGTAFKGSDPESTRLPLPGLEVRHQRESSLRSTAYQIVESRVGCDPAIPSALPARREHARA